MLISYEYKENAVVNRILIEIMIKKIQRFKQVLLRHKDFHNMCSKNFLKIPLIGQIDVGPSIVI